MTSTLKVNDILLPILNLSELLFKAHRYGKYLRDHSFFRSCSFSNTNGKLWKMGKIIIMHWQSCLISPILSGSYASCIEFNCA